MAVRMPGTQIKEDGRSDDAGWVCGILLLSNNNVKYNEQGLGRCFSCIDPFSLYSSVLFKSLSRKGDFYSHKYV